MINWCVELYISVSYKGIWLGVFIGIFDDLCHHTIERTMHYVFTEFISFLVNYLNIDVCLEGSYDMYKGLLLHGILIV